MMRPSNNETLRVSRSRSCSDLRDKYNFRLNGTFNSRRQSLARSQEESRSPGRNKIKQQLNSSVSQYNGNESMTCQVRLSPRRKPLEGASNRVVRIVNPQFFYSSSLQSRTYRLQSKGTDVKMSSCKVKSPKKSTEGKLSMSCNGKSAENSVNGTIGDGKLLESAGKLKLSSRGESCVGEVNGKLSNGIENCVNCKLRSLRRISTEICNTRRLLSETQSVKKSSLNKSNERKGFRFCSLLNNKRLKTSRQKSPHSLNSQPSQQTKIMQHSDKVKKIFDRNVKTRKMQILQKFRRTTRSLSFRETMTKFKKLRGIPGVIVGLGVVKQNDSDNNWCQTNNGKGSDDNNVNNNSKRLGSRAGQVRRLMSRRSKSLDEEKVFLSAGPAKRRSVKDIRERSSDGITLYLKELIERKSRCDLRVTRSEIRCDKLINDGSSQSVERIKKPRNMDGNTSEESDKEQKIRRSPRRGGRNVCEGEGSSDDMSDDDDDSSDDDEEEISETKLRPKRTLSQNSASSKLVGGGLSWREESDLQKALLASLRASRHKSDESSNNSGAASPQKLNPCSTGLLTLAASMDVCSFRPVDKEDEQEDMDECDSPLMTRKYHAVRKFASNAGLSCTLRSQHRAAASKVTQSLPVIEPLPYRTEDFLTMLCFRGTNFSTTHPELFRKFKTVESSDDSEEEEGEDSTSSPPSLTPQKSTTNSQNTCGTAEKGDCLSPPDLSTDAKNSAGLANTHRSSSNSVERLNLEESEDETKRGRGRPRKEGSHSVSSESFGVKKKLALPLKSRLRESTRVVSAATEADQRLLRQQQQQQQQQPLSEKRLEQKTKQQQQRKTEQQQQPQQRQRKQVLTQREEIQDSSQESEEELDVEDDDDNKCDENLMIKSRWMEGKGPQRVREEERGRVEKDSVIREVILLDPSDNDENIDKQKKNLQKISEKIGEGSGNLNQNEVILIDDDLSDENTNCNNNDDNADEDCDVTGFKQNKITDLGARNMTDVLTNQKSSLRTIQANGRSSDDKTEVGKSRSEGRVYEKENLFENLRDLTTSIDSTRFIRVSSSVTAINLTSFLDSPSNDDHMGDAEFISSVKLPGIESLLNFSDKMSLPFSESSLESMEVNSQISPHTESVAGSEVEVIDVDKMEQDGSLHEEIKSTVGIGSAINEKSVMIDVKVVAKRSMSDTGTSVKAKKIKFDKNSTQEVNLAQCEDSSSQDSRCSVSAKKKSSKTNVIQSYGVSSLKNIEDNIVTLNPTRVEMKDLDLFIYNKINATNCRAVLRIIPPSDWKIDCNISQHLRFPVNTQYINKLYKRWGPNSQRLACIAKQIECERSGWKLEHIPVIGGLEIDLACMWEAIQTLGGIQRIMDGERWGKLAELLFIPKKNQDLSRRLYDIYCNFLLSYDALSSDERQDLEDLVNTERTRNKITAADEECYTKSRSKSLGEFYQVAQNLTSVHFPSGNPTTEQIEEHFWSVVNEANKHVSVLQGEITKPGDNTDTKKQKSDGSSAAFFKNLSKNGVLKYLEEDVSGVTRSVTHVGMLYSSICWMRDQHSLPVVHYLHTGADIIWYFISCEEEEKLKSVMTHLCAELLQTNSPCWLPENSVMISPHVLRCEGVKVSSVVQGQGQLMVIPPGTFMSCVSTGYNISERINISNVDWLQHGLTASMMLQESEIDEEFSMEKLLLNIFLNSEDQSMKSKASALIKPILIEEVRLRKELSDLGVTRKIKWSRSEYVGSGEEGEKKRKCGDKERERDTSTVTCSETGKICYLSFIENEKADAVYCLKKSLIKLSRKKNFSNYRLVYRYSEVELRQMLASISS